MLLDDEPGAPGQVNRGGLDPVEAAAFAGAITRTIGLVAAAPVTHAEPYHLSNRFSSLDWVIAVIESVWGCDLSAHDVEGPLPDFDPVEPEQTKTHGVVNSRDQPLKTATEWRKLAAEQGYSIRQLVAHLSRTREFVGTPGAVADELAHYVRSGAIDGLNLAPNAVPTGFDDVVDRLVPALQERGVYPAEYPGTTLRANFGLPAPVAHRVTVT